MSEWQYEDDNPITNYTLGLELAPPIPPSSLRTIASMHTQFRRDLPRKVEQPMLTFQMAPQSVLQKPQLGGVVFDRVRENGTVAQALAVGGAQISYMTATYSRWREFEPVATRLLGQIARVVMASSPVTAIAVAVNNQFTWSGADGSSDLSRLLSSTTKFVAAHMLESSDHCHSFHGYLERLGEPSGAHRISNINVQTGDTSEGKRVASIAFIHRTVLESPITDFEQMFGPAGSDAPSMFGRAAFDMRNLNNRLLNDIILTAISAHIPGLVQ